MIPFSPPYVDEDIIEEVVSTIRSGWITTGPKVKALESEVIKLVQCKQALCVNSWTSGAILVLKWFGVGPGDEVIVPAYTYAATALSVLHCGAKPVMVDIGDDFTINCQKVREAITTRTKVIMPVDIAGLMCDYDEIQAIVNSVDVLKMFVPNSQNQGKLGRILILADAAHSIGATYKGRASGSITDITIFSFHAVKNITTAEGGAICLNLPESFYNEDEYSTMRLWSLNGQTKDAFTKSKAGGWRYDILFQGLKVNMPDLCAAVGLSQIKKYSSLLLKERRRVADYYSQFFANKEWAECPIIEDESRVSCNHLYALRIRDINEDKRDRMIEYITAQGVSVNVHFIPMPLLTLFKDLGYNIDNYPKAFDNYQREISLPIYPQLDNKSLAKICGAVDEAFLSI